MSATTYEDNFGSEAGQEESGGPKALREAFDKQKAENEALRKQLADRDAADRETQVDTFLKDKGLSDEARVLIGDQDPQKWYDDYTKVFGVPASKPDESSTAASTVVAAPGGPASTLTADEQQRIAAVTGVEALPFDPNNLEAREAYLDGATSSDDLLKRLDKVGLVANKGRR
jgi:hypothetical protein